MSEVRNALLTLGVTLLILAVLGEIGLRLWRGGDFRPDPRVIRSLVPNTEREVWGYETPENNSGLSTSIPEEPVSLGRSRTNNLGFRMIDDVDEKRPDEQRILLLGDSYLEADQVDQEDRFAERVSDWLQAETDGRWTLINAGIRSGSPLQYLMQLHHWAEELQPDIVIVFVGANDSPDDIRSRRRYGVVTDADGFPIRPEKQLSLAIVHHSHLARYLTRLTLFRMPDLFATLSPDRGPAEKRSWGSVHSWIELACAASDASRQVFMDGTGRYLKMLRDRSETLGAGFAVFPVHYPFYFPDEPSYRERFPAEFWADIERHGCAESQGRSYRDFLRDFFRENGMAHASTYETFLEAKGRNPQQKLWHFFDYHYNPPGHRLVADELKRLLTRMMAEG